MLKPSLRCPWRWRLLWSAALVILTTVCAHALPIPVSNHSFELPVTGPGTFITNAPPPGWAAYGDSLDFGGRTIGVLNPNSTVLYADPVPDGSNVGVTFLQPQMNDEAGLQQTLGATLQTLTQYTLTVEVGNLAYDGGPFPFTGFPGYRIDLLAGTTVIASDDDTLLPGRGPLPHLDRAGRDRRHPPEHGRGPQHPLGEPRRRARDRGELRRRAPRRDPAEPLPGDPARRLQDRDAGQGLLGARPQGREPRQEQSRMDVEGPGDDARRNSTRRRRAPTIVSASTTARPTSSSICPSPPAARAARSRAGRRRARASPTRTSSAAPAASPSSRSSPALTEKRR